MTNGGFHPQSNLQVPRLPGGVIKGLILAALGLILVFSSFYTLGPEQAGIVLRFGKFVRTTEPGLHFKLPFGVEQVTKVPIQRQLKEEFGFRTTTPGVRTQYSTSSFVSESGMLTGDLNAAQVEWVVQFRITDPYKYLFRVRNVRETFRAMSEAVMRKVVGDRTVNEVLTVGRQAVADQAQTQLQDLCDQYETGIKVEQVVLQDVNPPDPVKPSFNEVNQAEQEKDKLINEAQSDYNRIIPKAKGQALQTIQEAEGYAVDRVNRASGDSARFVALYRAYEKAPDVTRKRIYLETMNTVLPKVEHKVVVDDNLRGILPLLNLDAGSASGKKSGQ